MKEKLEGYDWRSLKAQRKYKKERARGGLELGIRKDWDCVKKKSSVEKSKEVIGVEIEKGKKKILIVIVYMGKNKKKQGINSKMDREGKRK